MPDESQPQPKPKHHVPKVTPVFVLQAVLGTPKTEAMAQVARLTEQQQASLIQAYADKDTAAVAAIVAPEPQPQS